MRIDAVEGEHAVDQGQGPTMRYETPRELLTRLKTSREESMQRLLTCLILEGPYPRWNTRSTPARRGLEFLRRLYELSFDGTWPGGSPLFVDELELRGRTQEERGGAPDYGVLWLDRVWLIELKSEVASHRSSQIPLYFELAHHHYPDALVDLTYLTPPLSKPAPQCAEWARYAHATWRDVAPLIRSVWSGPMPADQASVVDGLCEAIDLLHVPPSEWRAQVLSEKEAPMEAFDMAAAQAAVRETGEDHVQRAIGVVGDLDDLLELRQELRQWIAAQPTGSAVRYVRPWVWSAATSGGVALTPAGAEHGFELRVSRYEKELDR